MVLALILFTRLGLLDVLLDSHQRQRVASDSRRRLHGPWGRDGWLHARVIYCRQVKEVTESALSIVALFSSCKLTIHVSRATGTEPAGGLGH